MEIFKPHWECSLNARLWEPKYRRTRVRNTTHFQLWLIDFQINSFQVVTSNLLILMDLFWYKMEVIYLKVFRKIDLSRTPISFSLSVKKSWNLSNVQRVLSSGMRCRFKKLASRVFNQSSTAISCFPTFSADIKRQRFPSRSLWRSQSIWFVSSSFGLNRLAANIWSWWYEIVPHAASS